MSIVSYGYAKSLEGGGGGTTNPSGSIVLSMEDRTRDAVLQNRLLTITLEDRATTIVLEDEAQAVTPTLVPRRTVELDSHEFDLIPEPRKTIE